MAAASSDDKAALMPTVELQMEDAIAVPHVVQSETERTKFLRTESFDQVARRLAMYWKYRKAVFGDRWLLPMVRNATGALVKKVVEIVQSGFMALVSAPSPVYIVDTSHLPRPLDDEMTACIFYFGTIGSNERTQTTGIALVHVITGNGPQSLDTDPMRWTIIREALPHKINDILVVPTQDEGRQY